MASAWRSRWLDWYPKDETIEVSSTTALTKPTKTTFVSFVSAISGKSAIIQDPKGAPKNDPAEWKVKFEAWVDKHCAFRDGCFGGIGCLHVHFCAWCSTDKGGCTRGTFKTLLLDQGLQLDTEYGLVHGLLLAEDLKPWCILHPDVPLGESE